MHPSRILILRVAVVVLALSPFALAVPGIVRCVAPPPPEPVSPDMPDPSVAFSDTGPVLGFAMVAHHISNLPLYLSTVDRIADHGATALVIVTPVFQRHADSTRIRHLPRRCPTEAQLLAILQRARERGLRTQLQPIVLIEDPGEKEWRGVIMPSDWGKWWASYEAMIARFVEIADTADVDLLVIGSELNSTESHVTRWKGIIDRARASFDGQLGYSANWDRYDKVSFWPMLDVMSVSSYFELCRDDHDAPHDELVGDWIIERDKLLAAADKWKKPLMLSELGYPTLSWACAHPWNYVAEDGQQADQAAQARGYRAFFEAWSGTIADPTNRAIGFNCYHWDPYHHGEEDDTGYGIQGKPSYEITREGFAAIKRMATETGLP